MSAINPHHEKKKRIKSKSRFSLANRRHRGEEVRNARLAMKTLIEQKQEVENLITEAVPPLEINDKVYLPRGLASYRTHTIKLVEDIYTRETGEITFLRFEYHVAGFGILTINEDFFMSIREARIKAIKNTWYQYQPAWLKKLLS